MSNTLRSKSIVPPSPSRSLASTSAVRASGVFERNATVDGWSVPAGYQLPDWSAPIDVVERLRLAPRFATVKGLFLRNLVAQAEAHRVPLQTTQRFVPFMNYPLHDYLHLLTQIAPAAFPRVPLREALRRLGHGVYPAFAETLVGKMLYGVLGGDLQAVLRLAQKGYEINGSLGSGRLVGLTEQSVTYHLKDLWAFPEAHHVGVLEGTLRHYGKDPTVFVKIISPSEVFLHAVWS